MESADAGGTAIVRVAYDHAGVTVHSAHAPWLRGALWLASGASFVPGLLLSITIPASWWTVIVVAPPLCLGVVMAAVARRVNVPAPAVALLTFPMLLLGTWVLILAAIAWGPWSPVLAAVGIADFGVAAWMIYNVLWFPRDRWIRLTEARLMAGTKGAGTALRLEDIETLDVEYGLLVLGMRDGGFERVGDGLPASTLTWLARQVSEATVRRREKVIEDRSPPPEPLMLLLGMAGR